jgi:tRNAThr (cytosine32-N3)-methyltransferase
LHLPDELALLFTGIKASETRHVCNTSAIQVQLSDENENEDDINNFSPLETERATNPSDGLIASSIPLPSDDSHASRVTAQVLTKEMIASSSTCTPDSPSTPLTIHPNLLSPLANCPPHPLFAAEQLGVDRRLIVNRKRQLKMYRVWMQGKFRKL